MSRLLDVRRPDWLTPAHVDALVFLACAAVAGAAVAVLGAIVDRRLCRA